MDTFQLKSIPFGKPAARGILIMLVTLFLSRIPKPCAFPDRFVATRIIIPKSHRPSLNYATASRLFASNKKQKLLGSDDNSIVEISPSDHNTRPLRSLVQNDTGFDRRLVKLLRSQGISKSTPIQAATIPLLLAGHDVMASAQTGSGKTLMFALPLLDRLMGAKPKRGPSALILNPTRELAMQTADVLKTYAAAANLKVALATGGAAVSQQRRNVLSADIVVATPGRILQFIDERSLTNLAQTVKEVVVDEADRMLDLGFEPQLKRIARALGRQQQQPHIVNNNDASAARDEGRRTVLCSATFPTEVQRVASEFLAPNYYFVAAGRVGTINTGITQKLLWADGGPAERRKVVVQQVRSFQNNNKQDRTVVFCNTKDEAERLGAALKGFTTLRVVTGDKEQSERNKSLQLFRSGKIQTLVATDVAARGLDVPGIGLVVQAEAPRDIDTFVHRVGRTGRAGAKGCATAVLDGRCLGISQGLVELMQEANQEVPAWLMGMAHVAKARMVEEKIAIEAGGGALLDTTTTNTSAKGLRLKKGTSNEAFSGQDFRSSAEKGSFGSERDTSYYAFDEDAYNRLDGNILSLKESAPPNEQNEEALDTPTANDASNTVNYGLERDNEISDTKNPINLPFCRQKPSKALRSALKNISGSDKLRKKPDQRVLNSLSKRGANQQIRFEYLGMFPFEEVASVLSQRSGQDINKYDGLPRILMVAEKPSIAKAIADALSGPRGARQRRGISRALPVYEFTCNAPFLSGSPGNDTPENTRALITVTSVVGHVFSLGFVQDNQGRTDPSDFFHLPVVKQEEESTGKLRVVDHLRSLAAGCDHLVLWLDCDAEGENIAHEVIGVTRRAFEEKIATDRGADTNSEFSRWVHRARFSAITKEALRDAFRDLVEPDAALSRSVDARQELDLRVGVAMTRLLTWRFVGLARQRFSPATKLVSYGPCQTPALSFCVDRATEIEAFTAKEYWNLDVTVSSLDDKKQKLKWIVPSGHVVDQRLRERRYQTDESTERRIESATFAKDVAEQVIGLAQRKGATATIVGIENSEERMNAPLGLNTVAMLSTGSKAMGMSPKQMMNVAEKLYSAGFISYPRTETTRYDPNGFDVRAILREHASHPEWGKTASFLLRTKYAKSGRPPLRGYNAGDHPPITSLKAATRDEVGGGAAWRVYEFVTRNFLGSLGDEMTFTRRIYELEIDSDSGVRPLFSFEDIHVNSLGFAGACRWILRDIGANTPAKNASRSNAVVFKKGTSLPIVDAKIERCKTKPPMFLQEHELIDLMDKHRIGTDASMATHVNNIVTRNYVTLCDQSGDPLRPPRPPRKGQKRPPRQIGRYLVPTPLGISLINMLRKSCVTGKSDDEQESPAFALLSRPGIRAQMEDEVNQIAMGNLEKSDCLEHNLAWFETRFNELVASLSRERINDIAKDLKPTRDSLRYWQRLGAFEPKINQPQKADKQRTKKARRVKWDSQSKKGKKQITKGRKQKILLQK